MRFSAAVRRAGSGLVRAASPGKPDLRVAMPPELHGEHEGHWSPEELLAAACGSCFAVTLDAVAAHRDVPLHDVDVRATAVVDRLEGRYAVTHVELVATVETEPGRIEDVRRAAERAERACLVSGALAVPVRVRVDAGVSPESRRRAGLAEARSGQARPGSGAGASA